MPKAAGKVIGLPAEPKTKPPIDVFDADYRAGLITKAQAHEQRMKVQEKAKRDKTVANLKKEKEKQKIANKQKEEHETHKQQQYEQNTRSGLQFYEQLIQAQREEEATQHEIRRQEELRQEEERLKAQEKAERKREKKERKKEQAKQDILASGCVSRHMPGEGKASIEFKKGKELPEKKKETQTSSPKSFTSRVQPKSPVEQNLFATTKRQRQRRRQAQRRLDAKYPCEEQTEMIIADCFKTLQQLPPPVGVRPNDILFNAAREAGTGHHMFGYSQDVWGHIPSAAIENLPERNKAQSFVENGKPAVNDRRSSSEQIVCGAVDPLENSSNRYGSHTSAPQGFNAPREEPSLREGSAHRIDSKLREDAACEEISAPYEDLPRCVGLEEANMFDAFGERSHRSFAMKEAFTIGDLPLTSLPRGQARQAKSTFSNARKQPIERLTDYDTSSAMSHPPNNDMVNLVWQTRKKDWSSMLQNGSGGRAGSLNSHVEEIKTTPILSGSVLRAVEEQDRRRKEVKHSLPQFGLLGLRLPSSDATAERTSEESRSTDNSMEFSNSSTLLDHGPSSSRSSTAADADSPELNDNSILFLNNNAPWSAFICGSQGSGKSYTLSCMLESALFPSAISTLPTPLTGIVFHYGGASSRQPCEAAYLASKVPVRVLVSKSNFVDMKEVYSKLPGVEKDIKVQSMVFGDQHLDIQKMKSLMAIQDSAGNTPLYIETIYRILREMAIKRQSSKDTFSFAKFVQELRKEKWDQQQERMLNLRLALLASFMASSPQEAKPIWTFPPGTLTIIDLSDPFIDPHSASTLFELCLTTFLSVVGDAQGKIIALDEAHKFLTMEEKDTAGLTGELLTTIRTQRHLGARVIIATQEPTISPALLDLASFTVIHRFMSPAWMNVLSGHLAGASLDSNLDWNNNGTADSPSRDRRKEIFKTVVDLAAGEALVFCPSAMIDVDAGQNFGAGKDRMGGSDGDAAGGGRLVRMKKLGIGWMKVKVRIRGTVDGGRSLLASGERRD